MLPNPSLPRNEENGCVDAKNPSSPYPLYCLRRNFMRSPCHFSVWRHRRKILSPAFKARFFRFFLASYFFVSAPVLFAETFEGGLGLERTSVVSSIYQTSIISAVQADLRYARPFWGRWSVFAQYQTNTKNTLSAGVGGMVFDTEELHAKGGAIYNDGTAEISKVPVWIFRTSVGLGLFKYVDQLLSNNASLGSRNSVPVQADLYGLKFQETVIRFLNDDWAWTVSGTYLVASAENFGLSSNCLSLGILYRHD